MAGETRTKEIAPGVEMAQQEFTQKEISAFRSAYPRVMSVYGQNRGAIISQWMIEQAAAALELSQAAKHDIERRVGAFKGMRSLDGLVLQRIRPDYFYSSSKTNARIWDMTLSGLTAASFYGLAHNGDIGAAYNATQLYLRKELALMAGGLWEKATASPIDAVQFEFAGKPLPIIPTALQFRGTDYRAVRLGVLEYWKPAVQYRSQFQTNSAAGFTAAELFGCAVVSFEFASSSAPTQPSTTSP